MNEPAKRTTGVLIFSTIAVSLAYAILRYHLLGPVPWKDFPMFILNKGICLAAFLLLVMNFSFGPAKSLGLPIPESWLNARKAMGMTGFLLVMGHVFLSVLIFTPSVYPGFYLADGTLTLWGGLSMLFGVFALLGLWTYNMTFQTFLREDATFVAFITSRRFLLAALLLGAAHLFFMGYQGWLNPAAWHGGLPPISLVAFTVFVVGYLTNLLGRE